MQAGLPVGHQVTSSITILVAIFTLPLFSMACLGQQGDACPAAVYVTSALLVGSSGISLRARCLGLLLMCTLVCLQPVCRVTQRQLNITVQKKESNWWERLTKQEKRPLFLAPDFDRWLDESDAEMELKEKVGAVGSEGLCCQSQSKDCCVLALCWLMPAAEGLHFLPYTVAVLCDPYEGQINVRDTSPDTACLGSRNLFPHVLPQYCFLSCRAGSDFAFPPYGKFKQLNTAGR